MSDVSDLARRIDGAFAAVKEKAQQQIQQRLQEFQDRQGQLKEYEKAQRRSSRSPSRGSMRWPNGRAIA